MRRHVKLFAAALVPLCAAVALCALTLAPRAAGQSATNTNGNMGRYGGSAPQTESPASNSNSNVGVLVRDPVRPRPAPRAPVVRWAPVASVPGYISGPQLTIRAGAGALAAVVEKWDGHNYESAEVLETAGEFLRVRFETGGNEEVKARRVEGWVAWGEVMPHTTALVLEARTGRVLARHALGSAIDAVSFSPDGKRALFQGEWAPVVYEADASDLAPTRQLTFEGNGTFAPAVYVGSGHDLLAPFWAEGPSNGGEATTLYAVRADGGGNVTVTPFARAPSGVEPTRIDFAPDGRTGFAFYAYPYGDEAELPEGDERASATTIEVFDPATMQALRRFKLPSAGLSLDPGSTAMNADGSELYLLDQTGQRLVVVETQAGGVVREVSLAGEAQRMLSLAQATVDASGPRISYWEVNEDHHGDPHTLRVSGGRAVDDESGRLLTVEAGGTRYAVDDTGARLLTLGDDGRPVKVHDIPRREGDYQMPVGLFATPDGSRLVLLLALPEDGC